jgi:hypothetical protein
MKMIDLRSDTVTLPSQQMREKIHDESSQVSPRVHDISGLVQRVRIPHSRGTSTDFSSIDHNPYSNFNCSSAYSYDRARESRSAW